MSAVDVSTETGGVERIPSAPRPNIVSDELRRIAAMLIDACPPETDVSFHFEDALYVHIDVRNLEHVTIVEAILPKLGAGIFHDIQRGSAPHRPFFHRVSARVDR
ncbi:hypothetical protein [Sphingomonas sp. KC8]|uniref:hypothetical protein n=1 Tax=Sphingomonas sp. KC8 TaxID=1030157 RepID=UPI000A31D307|nr:hypothetical protein [Sphingomonas sp. KC8]ARS27671.1 hypothetical protein KC8_10250 [Sphingomonas sp. KC8]